MVLNTHVAHSILREHHSVHCICTVILPYFERFSNVA
jgi:hypothetical protein